MEVPQPAASARSKSSSAKNPLATGPVTVTECVTDADAPAASVTVSVTSYVPAAAYVWASVTPVPGAPASPQFHEYEAIAPSASLDAEPSTFSAKSAEEDVNAATGGVFAVPGAVTVTDFTAAQRDVLDLRGVLQPQAGRWLPAYVQMSGTELRVDANGDGSGYTDLTIRLTNATLPADIADLWDSGALETGEVAPQTTLFLTTSGQAAEENLTPAAWTLRRRGDAGLAAISLGRGAGPGALGDDQPGTGTLRVIVDHQRVGPAVNVGPVARHRRHHDAVGQAQLAQRDRFKQER